MKAIHNYLPHWVIGIVSAIVWATGKHLDLDPTFITFASWTLPVVVGHALGMKPEPAPPLGESNAT